MVPVRPRSWREFRSKLRAALADDSSVPPMCAGLPYFPWQHQQSPPSNDSAGEAAPEAADGAAPQR
jgi:hypothetical protein